MLSEKSGEYNDGMHDENKAWNDGTALKDSIPYWEILVCKFQGKDGIGICIGDSNKYVFFARSCFNNLFRVIIFKEFRF